MRLANGKHDIELVFTAVDGRTLTYTKAIYVTDGVVLLSLIEQTNRVNGLSYKQTITLDAITETNTLPDVISFTLQNYYFSLGSASSTNDANSVSVLSSSTVAFSFGSANESTTSTLFNISVEYTEANILSATPIRVGEVFTVTTDGIPDLTTMTVTATFGGINLGAGSNITPTTVEFTAPLFGLQLGANHELIVGVA